MTPTVESNVSCTVAAISRFSPARPAPSGPVPLTFQQEFMFRHLMQPEVATPVSNAFRLRGSLNIEVLCKSLSLVIARNESLRTRIVCVDGVQRQLVDEPGIVELKVLHFSGASTADIEADVRRFLQKFVWRRLELTTGPLFDMRVLQIADRDYVLALVLHHLITDATSFNLLLREIWSSYSAFARGQHPNLPAVSIQYPDYALWQRNEHGRWLKKHESYWSKRLADAVSAKLPRDDGLERVSPHKVSIIDMPFEQLSGRLHELARHLRTSTAIVLLALYTIVLARWSGQSDFVLPYVVSGRLGSMDLNVMGYVGQFLLLRMELQGDATFIDMITLVTREFFGAYEHLDFGKVIHTHPEILAGVSLNGLIGTMDALSLTELNSGSGVIAVETFPMMEEEMAAPEEFRHPSEVYCLLWSTTEGIHARCMYRADLFNPQTINCFLEDFRSFAQQVAQDPTRRIASLRGWRHTDGDHAQMLPAR